jgi:malonyl CoA-acyl carrier protein transacylase
MAAVGLSWAECKQICPLDIVPACHNAADSVTVSGPKESIEKFVDALKAKKIFAKEVACNQVPFHSHYMNDIVSDLLSCFITYLKRSFQLILARFTQRLFTKCDSYSVKAPLISMDLIECARRSVEYACSTFAVA